MQDNLNKQFERDFNHTKQIVECYLELCWSCRNSDEHMINHIRNKYPYLNFETLRRTRQKIQNTEKRLQADIEIQAWRQAKQHFMEKKM
jgi:hypothetical protein